MQKIAYYLPQLKSGREWTNVKKILRGHNCPVDLSFSIILRTWVRIGHEHNSSFWFTSFRDARFLHCIGKRKNKQKRVLVGPFKNCWWEVECRGIRLTINGLKVVGGWRRSLGKSQEVNWVKVLKFSWVIIESGQPPTRYKQKKECRKH